VTDISFFVSGHPVPKQSFVYDGHGHGHSKPEVKAWQSIIRWRVGEDMRLSNYEVIIGPLELELSFVLLDKRRRDLDNLSKAVCDALNGLLYLDDSQIVKLTITKTVDRDKVGVHIVARPHVSVLGLLKHDISLM
jgi:Holliday junction resolvase RusA-like endonuclease